MEAHSSRCRLLWTAEFVGPESWVAV